MTFLGSQETAPTQCPAPLCPAWASENLTCTPRLPVTLLLEMEIHFSLDRQFSASIRTAAFFLHIQGKSLPSHGLHRRTRRQTPRQPTLAAHLPPPVHRVPPGSPSHPWLTSGHQLWEILPDSPRLCESI